MIVSQQEIDEIRSARIKRRVIYLPVRYGPVGERKRCPARPGGVYHLRPRLPYAEHMATAEREPSRARAVVRFLQLCEVRGRTVTVSVLEPPQIVERDGSPVWAVAFEKSDLTLARERARARFLKAGGAYTTVRDELDAGEVMDDEVAKRFVEEAAKAQREAQLEAALQLASHTETLRASMDGMKLRNRAANNAFARAAKEFRKAADALSVHGGTIPSSQSAESAAPVAVEDPAGSPNGICSVVPAESTCPA